MTLIPGFVVQGHICWTHPQAIHDVDVDFVFIWETSNTSIAHQGILCSEWVPSELESKQLIITSQ